jgi:two-component SAPR family response regulator
MSKLKVAILDDNKHLLKDLKLSLEETGLVEVIAWSVDSEEFIEKVEQAKPEALILDIDLGPAERNGIGVAHKLKLPVLFISGKTPEFLHGLEELNLNSTNTVEHISKPVSLEKLKKILPKFTNEI